MPVITTIPPWIVFLGVWGFVSVLFESQFSYLLYGFDERFIYSFLAVLAMFCSGYLLAFIIGGKCKHRYDSPKLKIPTLERVNWILMIIWGGLSIVDIIASGGITFIWLIQGSGKTYSEFGVHGLHGLANAVYAIVVLNYFIIGQKTHKKKYIFIILFLLLWPILIVSRQVFISTVLELFFLVLLYYRVSIIFAVKTVAALLVVIYGFGVIGDFRSGADAFVELAQPRYDWLTALPSGILWVGMYLASPIANFQNQVLTTVPIDQFSVSVAKLIPSVFRSSVLDDAKVADDGLITPAFNASSYMSDFYADFGFPYLLVFTFIVGFLARYVFVKMYRSRKYNWTVLYCVLQQMLFLSIFYNHFFFLPISFQIVICLIEEKFLRYERQ